MRANIWVGACHIYRPAFHVDERRERFLRSANCVEQFATFILLEYCLPAQTLLALQPVERSSPNLARRFSLRLLYRCDQRRDGGSATGRRRSSSSGSVAKELTR